MMITVFFYLAAAGLVAAALLVVLSKSPLYSAGFLIVALCMVALHYVLLEASFVAAMQVLVYAGAIVVLFVFVIMLLNLRRGAAARPGYLSTTKVLGAAGAAYIVFTLGRAVIMSVRADSAAAPAELGTVLGVGKLLLTRYLFAFEAVSVLLLVAVVGAVVLGQRKLS